MGSRFFDKCDTRKDIYFSKCEINVLTYCTVNPRGWMVFWCSRPLLASSSPPWTSHGRPTAVTALGAHATATVGNDVRLAQCESIAQLRAAILGRLGILRPCNGESLTLWVAKHVRGQGQDTRGVDRFSKTAITRRCTVWGCCLGPLTKGPRARYTTRRRMHKRDCHNEVVGARVHQRVQRASTLNLNLKTGIWL